MKIRASIMACLAVATLGGCGKTTIPQTNKALRPVPLTSQADVQAYEVADAVDDQLRVWCADAVEVRELKEMLSAEDPIIDGRAAAEIERLREASRSVQSEELRSALEGFAIAHEGRLAVLRDGPKFRAKSYLRAERKVAEIAFGLRRWRLQR